MHDDRMFNQMPIDRLPVAMAYVPWQQWEELFDLTKGYKCGTIFPSLSKPFAEGALMSGGCRS